MRARKPGLSGGISHRPWKIMWSRPKRGKGNLALRSLILLPSLGTIRKMPEYREKKEEKNLFYFDILVE